MNIYNLNDVFSLENDINYIISMINDMYDPTYSYPKSKYCSKIVVDNNHSWVSEEAENIFNQNIPKIKTIHTAMYPIIEHIYKAKYGKFTPIELEKEYSSFKHFRLLNNKFKHLTVPSVEIDIMSVVKINGGSSTHIIEIFFQFKRGDKIELYNYTDFIDLFFQILIDKGMIQFKQ